MSDPFDHFRHHVTRRRAEPGRVDDQGREMRIARQLERLRVDVIEAGFPASSNGDWEAVHDIAKGNQDSIVCGLARANENISSVAARRSSLRHRRACHTFIATSPIHMQMKLRMTPDQVFEQAVKAVGWARRYTDNIEFSPEDAGRSDPDFLCRLLEAVIKAGARTVNIPDTFGYTMPVAIRRADQVTAQRIPNSDQAVWSVHCHNDLGLAVANSLSP